MLHTEPVTLFLSYAHEDEAFCQEFKKHLRLLERQGLLSAWSDRQIPAGTNWAEEIDHQFEHASIILLLISADFLASDYCYSQEMTQALERHAAGKAQVIPILLRSCDWKSAPFARLQMLPSDARPISTWHDQDEAWTNIVAELRRALVPQSELVHAPGASMAAPTPPASPRTPSRALSRATLEQRNRVRFLTKLCTSYRDLLQASLQGAVQIALELQSKPNAVLNSTRLRLRQPNLPEQSLPAETTLLQVFDDAGGELLVLGSPGAGKTTLLLNLAEALYQRAEQDEQAFIPVMVNLSTWAATRKPLAEWLVEEIMQSYEVPRGPITRWVQQDQFLPLLDGLDEVDVSALPACIEAINIYKQQHLVPLVVCCRTGDYHAQQDRLVLQNAVVIQPLEEDRVDAYFKAAGKPQAGIRSVLRKNAELRELVRTPLMLHVLTRAYQGISVQALPKKGTIQQQQQQIFHHYVKRMLDLPHAHISSQSMIHWLTFLARQMRSHNLTVFYVEHLQPGWLSDDRAQRIYDIFAVKLAGLLMGMLVSVFVTVAFSIGSGLADTIWYALLGGLIGWLLSGSSVSDFRPRAVAKTWVRRWRQFCFLGTRHGLILALLTGIVFLLDRSPGEALIYGMGTGLCSFFLSGVIEAGKLAIPRTPSQHQRQRWLITQPDHLRLSAFTSLILGVSLGICFWLSNSTSNGVDLGMHNRISNGLSNGVSLGISFGIISILLSMLLLGKKKMVEPAEIIGWSVKDLGQSLLSRHHLTTALSILLLLFLFFGLTYALTYGISDGLNSGLHAGLNYGVGLGLSGSLLYWAVVGLWKGLSPQILEDHRKRIKPNQGIRWSIRNGLLMGLIAGVFCELGGLFLYILYFSLTDGLALGLSEGLNYAQSNRLGVDLPGVLLAALYLGGLAGLRHLLLRIQLAHADQLPWRTIPFLNAATRCILLYRDGGGYRFIHRLLLDYFADCVPDALPVQRVGQKQEKTLAPVQEAGGKGE